MSKMVEIAAAELARLRDIEADYRKKFCAKCGNLAVVAMGRTCGKMECPLVPLLDDESKRWRLKYPGQIRP